MDVRRDALLADAGLALDEDDGVELGGAADDAQEVEGRGVLGDELGRGEELVADDGHLLLEAGGEPLLVVQPLLEGDQLGDVADVGDDETDAVVAVVDGGAGDDGASPGGEGLLQGDGLLLGEGPVIMAEGS